MGAFGPKYFEDDSINSSFRFYGNSTSTITVPNSSDFSFGNVTGDLPYTISCYVKLNGAINQNYKSFLTTGLRGWNFGLNAYGQLELWLINKNSTDQYRKITGVSTLNNVLLYNFLHLTITYDGSNYVMYINGAVIVRSVSQNVTFVAQMNSTYPLGINSNTFKGPYSFFDGFMSSAVIIKNYALTQLQVSELYNGGKVININDTSIVSDIGGLVGVKISQWLMDKNDDPTGVVNDVVGAHNGVAQGASIDYINYPN